MPFAACPPLKTVHRATYVPARRFTVRVALCPAATVGLANRRAAPQVPPTGKLCWICPVDVLRYVNRTLPADSWLLRGTPWNRNPVVGLPLIRIVTDRDAWSPRPNADVTANAPASNDASASTANALRFMHCSLLRL